MCTSCSREMTVSCALARWETFVDAKIDPKIAHFQVARAVRTHPLERLPESKNGLLGVYDGSNLEPATRRQWKTYLYAAAALEMPFVMVPKITNCHPVGVHCFGLCQTQIWHDKIFCEKSSFAKKLLFFILITQTTYFQCPKGCSNMLLLASTWVTKTAKSTVLLAHTNSENPPSLTCKISEKKNSTKFFFWFFELILSLFWSLIRQSACSGRYSRY